MHLPLAKAIRVLEAELYCPDLWNWDNFDKVLSSYSNVPASVTKEMILTELDCSRCLVGGCDSDNHPD
nr:hypothetical protein [Pseudoalteromonas sp. TB13]